MVGVGFKKKDKTGKDIKKNPLEHYNHLMKRGKYLSNKEPQPESKTRAVPHNKLQYFIPPCSESEVMVLV